MGRQFRGLRRGGNVSGNAAAFVGPAVVTSSSVVTVIPNYGITDITTWAAGTYVLDTPETGVEKTILSWGDSTLARIIQCSTVQPGAVTIGGAVTSPNTRITFKTSDSLCLTLIGINSTMWVVRAMQPPTAANSTGIVLGTS